MPRERAGHSKHPLSTTQEKTLHTDIITKIRLIIFFTVKDGEALHSPQKQDQELTVAQIMNSLLQISDKFKKVGETTRPFRYDINQILYDYTVEVTNRFNGLDLSDRVPEELWTEVHDIVQVAGIKIILKGKKCKKEKWMSEEALQITVNRKEAKAKETRKDIPI